MTGALIRLSRPTWRRGLTSVTLQPGVIDDDAREVYAWGYCHVLAAALHELTGWQLGVLQVPFGPPGRQLWHWIHAGVHPGQPGLLLDVNGVRQLPAVAADYARPGGPVRWAGPAGHRSFCAITGLPAGTPAGWWRQDLSPAAAAAILALARDLAGQARSRRTRRRDPRRTAAAA